MAQYNKIDPTEGLLQYVKEIKPYHSKILDVLVEYIYQESITATVSDSMSMDVGFLGAASSTPAPAYVSGYGDVWDSSNTPTPIVEEVGYRTVSVVSVSGANVTLEPNHNLTVGTLVSLKTTGTIPTTTPQLYSGSVCTVSSVVGDVVQLSTTSVVSAWGSFTGQLSLGVLSSKANSFLVSPTLPRSQEIFLSDADTGTFRMGTRYQALSVSLAANTITLSGAVSLTPSTVLYVRMNSDPVSNGSYRVASATYSAPNTTVTLIDPLPISIVMPGTVFVSINEDDTPWLVSGNAVTVTGTTLPFPLSSITQYYYQPIRGRVEFNLSTTRFPTKDSEYVKNITQPSVSLTLQCTEPFVPGNRVAAVNTYGGGNDRKYTVKDVTFESPNYRVYVTQLLRHPPAQGSTGTLQVVAGYGGTRSVLSPSKGMNIATYVSDSVAFEFGTSFVQPYILDTFSGSDTLDGYVSDSGHVWSVFQLTDELSELVMNGNGYLSTSDTDIWIRNNWTPPTQNLYTEIDVSCGPGPASGSPYLRMFLKNTLGSFTGPHVDMLPNNTTSTVWLNIWNGTSATQINTYLPFDQRFTLRVSCNVNTLEVKVNNVVLYTNGTVSIPSLSVFGLNFVNPHGTPSQFSVSRYQGDAV